MKRRGFLKSIGVGAAVAVVVPASILMGKPKPKVTTYIDGFAKWDRMLTMEEVAQLYAADNEWHHVAVTQLGCTEAYWMNAKLI